MPLIGSCQDYPCCSKAESCFRRGGGGAVNKWQNKRQSWFGHPRVALHTHVLQQEPCNASPWLFSVNSALSRPSILPSSLMSQQSLPSQPPTPSPPPANLTLSLLFSVFCRYKVILLFLLEGIRTCNYSTKQIHLKKKDEPCFVHAMLIILLRLYVRRHGWALLKCWPTTFLSTVIPFLLLIHQRLAMKIALEGKMVCILTYSVGVRPLYHSDVSVKSWLVDSKCFLSDHQAGLPKR